MDRWTLIDADPAEREWFADLDRTLALDWVAAAPPNRLRAVHRLRLDGRGYFLKVFSRTQAKNRLRNRLTAPRCDLDAEREAAVARALRERGVRTARAIAVGRRGAASYYLCAELPGRSLRDVIAGGGGDDALAHRAAEFAGAIGRRGVALPDLSPDHVFVAGAGCDELAVIDLHNGRLGGFGRRDARRVLRRSRKALRGLSVRRGAALRLALRFLRAAGLRADARRILRTLPPLDTHGRYDAPGKSRAYRERDPRRTAEELTLLRTVWPGRPGDTVVDAPCGGGRLGPLLADLGARAIGVDRSRAMLGEARGAPGYGLLALGDAAALPIADRGAAGVVSFRFLHHLDRAAGRAAFDEAARVAGDWLVVSFFHPVSLHNAVRRLRELGGRPRTRHTLTLGRVRAWAAEAGFRPHAVAAAAPYRRDLWVAAFRRVSPRRGPG